MRKSTIAVLIVIAGLAAAPATAQETKPIQLSLWDPVQIHKNTTSVKGFRFNLLYGVNDNMTGVDIGLVNRTTGRLAAFQIGFVGMTGELRGWQLNLVNISNGATAGLQGPDAVYNSAVTMTGGVQIGLVNRAESFSGLQLGLINVTDTLDGLQIALLNVVGSREKWKYLPIVSWSF